MRGYRSERAAMRQALRTALREARAGLRIRRAATLSVPAPPAPTPPAPDIPVADICGAEMRAADTPAPSHVLPRRRALPASSAPRPPTAPGFRC